jgi:hypothetical protein
VKLLLDVVAAWSKALVSKQVLYACDCRLWAQPQFDTLNEIIMIVGTLWLHPILQISKQVIISRSKITSVRSAVKNSQLKISRNVLMLVALIRLVAMEKHCIPHHFCFWSGPIQNSSDSQYTSDVIVIPCCTNSPSSLISCSVQENSCH